MKLMINEDHMTDEEILQAFMAFFDGSERFAIAGVIEGKTVKEDGMMDVLILTGDDDEGQSYIYREVTKALEYASQVVPLDWNVVPV